MIDSMSIYVKNFFTKILIYLTKCCKFEENTNVLITGRTGLGYPVAFLIIDRQREIFLSYSCEDEISMTSSDLLLGRGLW